MKYKISTEASDDIENIWLYTLTNWSLEQADRYYNLIMDEIEYVAKNPSSGIDYNHVREGYSCSKVKSHLIFYRQSNVPDEIEIIRVLHQRMDIKNRLS